MRGFLYDVREIRSLEGPRRFYATYYCRSVTLLRMSRNSLAHTFWSLFFRTDLGVPGDNSSYPLPLELNTCPTSLL
jgi:hypothetical protein